MFLTNRRKFSASLSAVAQSLVFNDSPFELYFHSTSKSSSASAPEQNHWKLSHGKADSLQLCSLQKDDRAPCRRMTVLTAEGMPPPSTPYLTQLAYLLLSLTCLRCRSLFLLLRVRLVSRLKQLEKSSPLCRRNDILCHTTFSFLAVANQSSV